jgi:glycosyl hydrolase family 26
MKNASLRIITTLVAIAISSLIVYALSHAGQSTKGPIENAMTYTGDVVKDIEQKIIVESRPEKRSDKLQWLKPYFQNRNLLLHPNKILLGAFDNEAKESYEPIVSLEDSLKTTFPLIQIYAAWGSKPDEKFPAAHVREIIDLGSIPVITWEPWLNDFNDEDYPNPTHPEDRNKNGMQDVAKGTYDAYLIQWAQSAKKINKPIFLRLGHEMNDGYRYPWGPHNNTPQDFIAAWQHVHDVFIKEGAKNIIWMWSPHPAYAFKEFYPGSEYVDYVGVGALNYGTIAKWSQWWSFKEIFGNYYDSLASYKKPIIITEFGCLAVGGNRAKWFADALDSLPRKYPMVKSILFFHYSKDNTTTQQTLNWYFKDDHPVTKAIIREVGKWK